MCGEETIEGRLKQDRAMDGRNMTMVYICMCVCVCVCACVCYTYIYMLYLYMYGNVIVRPITLYNKYMLIKRNLNKMNIKRNNNFQLINAALKAFLQNTRELMLMPTVR
jgi:Flp pilus assembly protein TadB